MSASTASSESTITSVSDKNSAKSSQSDHDEFSSDFDEEKLPGQRVVRSRVDPATEDDIWHQALWTFKLGSDDMEYLQSEVGKLLETSAHWHEEVFYIPTKTQNISRIPDKGQACMASLQECKALLLNPVDAYKMVAATQALRNANDKTLQCVFEGNPDSLEWIRIWLELFNLIFRRIVDADSKRGIENDERTRQIFREILRSRTFKGPKVLSCTGIDEYRHGIREHKITYLDDEERVIKEWRYPGWLPEEKKEKGKSLEPSLFHTILKKESQRKLKLDKVLRELEAKFCEAFEAPKKDFEAAERELEATEKELEDAERELEDAEKELEAAKKGHKPAKEKVEAARKKHKDAKDMFEGAKKKHETAKEKYNAAKKRYEVAKVKAEQDPKRKKRLEDMDLKREEEKEQHKNEYLKRKEEYEREEEKMNEEIKRKWEKGKKTQEEKKKKEKEERDKKKENALKRLKYLSAGLR